MVSKDAPDSFSHPFDVVTSHDERRKEPEDFLARRERQNALLGEAVHIGASALTEFDTDHETEAAHFRAELAFQGVAVRFHVPKKPVGGHDVEHRVGESARERISTECRAVRARRELEPVADDDGTHGESCGDALRETQDVGRQLVVLARKQSSGATEAGLDFIDDEKDSVLAAKRGRTGDEVVLGK